MKGKTMKSVYVSNPWGVKDQFMIHTEDGAYFQSYDRLIAFRSNDGDVILDEVYWDYSKTTGKYRNKFLIEGIKETRAKIKSGEYTLKNLAH